MANPFVQNNGQGFKTLGQLNALPAPIAPQTGAIEATAGANAVSSAQNPFMTALNTNTASFTAIYGKNQPPKDPIFLGYRDDKPLMGGSKLFVLC